MTKQDSSTNSLIVTTQEISEIFGISARRIQQLTKEGAFVKVDRGKFHLQKSIYAFCDYQTLKNLDLDGGELDGAQETAKWTRARRMKAELEVKIIKGELHRSDDVERVMNDMLGAFRARLLSMPSKLAPQLLGKTDIPVIKQLLKDAVYEAMDELSNYNPQVFYDYSNDKMLIDDDGDVETDVLSDDSD